MNRTSRGLGAAALTLLTLIAAPASAQKTTEAPDAAASQRIDREVRILVHNNNFYDATVYVSAVGTSSIRWRLGQVGSFQEQVFKLPAHLKPQAGSLRLRVLTLGSRSSYDSPDFMVAPGEVVELRLESHIQNSTVRITG